jgi:hypothetical protein
MKSVRIILVCVFMFLLKSTSLYAADFVNDTTKTDTLKFGVTTFQENEFVKNIKYNPTNDQIDSLLIPITSALTREYGLSTEQQKQVHVFSKEYVIALLKVKTLKDTNEQYSIMNDVTKNYTEKLDSVLNDGQKEKKENKIKNKTINTKNK